MNQLDKKSLDDASMVEGISQILGYKPYRNVPATDPCDHEDDGFEYGETKKMLTLRCGKCGEFYEKEK